MTWLSRRPIGTSTGTDPPASLFEQLRAEFPEASEADIGEALDRAHVVASALEGNADVSRDRLAALARDRLEIIRTRSATASRRAGRHKSAHATENPAGQSPTRAARNASGRAGDRRAGNFREEGIRRYDRLLGLVLDQVAVST